MFFKHRAFGNKTVCKTWICFGSASVMPGQQIIRRPVHTATTGPGNPEVKRPLCIKVDHSQSTRCHTYWPARRRETRIFSIIQVGGQKLETFVYLKFLIRLLSIHSTLDPLLIFGLQNLHVLTCFKGFSPGMVLQTWTWVLHCFSAVIQIRHRWGKSPQRWFLRS